MFARIARDIFGTANERTLKRFQARVPEISALEPALAALSDEALRGKTADVTYGTNNEFGFDYLRDNMKYRLDEMVQRDFNYAIVDEVDSILIDEARTPLIISGPAEDSSDLYRRVDAVVEEMLREAGLLTEGDLYDFHNVTLVHHVNQSLRAHTLFQRDVDYIEQDDK